MFFHSRSKRCSCRRLPRSDLRKNTGETAPQEASCIGKRNLARSTTSSEGHNPTKMTFWVDPLGAHHALRSQIHPLFDGGKESQFQMHCTFWSDVYKILQERLSLTTPKFTRFFGATSDKNLPFASPVEPLRRPSHSDDIISWPVAGGEGGPAGHLRVEMRCLLQDT